MIGKLIEYDHSFEAIAAKTQQKIHLGIIINLFTIAIKQDELLSLYPDKQYFLHHYKSQGLTKQRQQAITNLDDANNKMKATYYEIFCCTCGTPSKFLYHESHFPKFHKHNNAI